MSEDFADRIHAPTPRRREQFRQQGKIARSADLTSAIVMIGCLILLCVCGAPLAASLESLLRSAFALSPDASTVTPALDGAAKTVFGALTPLLAGVLAIAIAANLIQIGRPVLKRREPSRGRPRFSFWTALAKLIALSLFSAYFIANRLPQFLQLDRTDISAFLGAACRALLVVSLQIALVLLVFGLIDYTTQRIRLERQLRMTRRELEEEQRQTEGDPKIKQRRRQLAAIIRSRAAQN